MMLPFLHNNLEQLIIASLQNGPVSTTDLLRLLKKRRLHTTKQGMYRVIRRLVAAEVMLKHKKQVSLNVAWLTKLESFVALTEHYYSGSNRSGSFLGLRNSETIKYEFRNLTVTDAFWNHVLYLLIEAHPKTPWLAYNPHCWFYLARPESERALRDFIIKKGGQYLIMAGGAKPLDRSIRKEFDGKRSQYFLRHSPLFRNTNYYVSVIGDYLVEVRIDPIQAQAFEDLYASADALDEKVRQKAQTIIHARGRTRLTVSHNYQKAEKLRKKLAKPFYIPKPSR